MSCKKAQGFLEAKDLQVTGPVVDATRERRGRDEAMQLAKSVGRVVASKGKKVVVFDMSRRRPTTTRWPPTSSARPAI